MHSFPVDSTIGGAHKRRGNPLDDQRTLVDALLSWQRQQTRAQNGLADHSRAVQYNHKFKVFARYLFSYF